MTTPDTNPCAGGPSASPSGVGERAGPVLYLDVDGVLNPFRSKGPHKHWPDYTKHTVTVPNGRSYRMWFSRSLGRLLTEQCHDDGIEIVWATSWAAHVDTLIADLANIPTGLRVLHYPDSAEDDHRNTGKVDQVAADAGTRPVIWIDDYLGPDDRSWADTRPEPTLLIRPSPSTGLRPVDLETIRAWTGTLQDR